MKRGTPDHPKVFELLKALGLKKKDRPYVLGILELLWHKTGAYAPAGDIGRYSDEWIEASLDWVGKPGWLIQALLDSRWLDQHEKHRLVVHDWADHADQAVKRKLANRGAWFVVDTAKEDSLRPEMNYPAGAEPEPLPEPRPDPGRFAAVPNADDRPTESHQDQQNDSMKRVGLEEVERVREMLFGYVEHFRLGWDPPDDAICQRVLRAAGGDLKGLQKFLEYLAKDRRQAPSRSYAWFERVVQNQVNGRAL